MNPWSAPMQFRLRSRSYRLLCLSLSTMLLTRMLPLLPVWAQETVPAGDGGVLGQLQSWLVDTLAWIDGLGPIAPIAFILLYIIITVAFLPASVVTLGAGVVFGVVKGSLLVFVGAMLGATAAFLVGRYLARGWVSRKIAKNDKFMAIDEAIAQEGRKIIFLLRLSPVFPFNALNYTLGLTKVSLRDYLLGTVGILPGTVMYVYLGSLVGNLATLGTGETPENPVITWTIRLLAFFATLAVTLYVTRIARKALSESVPSITDETNGDDNGQAIATNEGLQ